LLSLVQFKSTSSCNLIQCISFVVLFSLVISVNNVNSANSVNSVNSVIV